jgi:arylsulfatase A-like enzyme
VGSTPTLSRQKKMQKKLKPFMLACFLFFFSTSLLSQNVIIIAVDTLRADHLGCYGYPRNTSPNIDGFASDGVKFNACYTPSPLTTPAFASMLSSLPPYKHGAKRNGLSIFDRIQMLPQYLKEMGYHTGAFVSNWTLKKKLTHLDRGFDTYSEVLTKKRWFGLINPEGEAPEVNREIYKWLYRNEGKKFFLFVHYTEPHDPYVYHKKFDMGYNGIDPAFYPEGSNHKKIKKYDTEISFVDFYIGELIQKIKDYSLYENSLVIFLADHGESFGEHDYFGHGRRLYNSCLHVPLIVKRPEDKLEGVEINRNVSLLDVAPTILSLLGYPVPDDMEGENLFGQKNQRILFFEAYKGAVHSERSDMFHLRVKPVRYGLVKDKDKLIFDEEFEAYDLAKDPFELTNIYDNQDKTFAELATPLREFILKVQKFIEYSKKFRKQRSDLTKEELERLKALGYIK